jgi:hypothetical protein
MERIENKYKFVKIVYGYMIDLAAYRNPWRDHPNFTPSSKAELPLSSRLLNFQRQAKHRQHLHHRADRRITLWSEGRIKRLSAKPGLFRNLRYPARAGDYADGVGQEGGVAAFERVRYQPDLRVFGLEIFFGFERLGFQCHG